MIVHNWCFNEKRKYKLYGYNFLIKYTPVSIHAITLFNFVIFIYNSQPLIYLTSQIMAKEDVLELLTFMDPYPTEIQQKALWLRDFVWDMYPTANELIYDNYNALAFGWSPTDKVGHTFCSIAIGRTSMNLHFGFYWGSKIADPEHMLIGNGKQYRYILVKDVDDFPKEYMKTLVKEAYANSLAMVKDERQLVQGKTITKSVSPAKRQKKK